MGTAEPVATTEAERLARLERRFNAFDLALNRGLTHDYTADQILNAIADEMARPAKTEPVYTLNSELIGLASSDLAHVAQQIEQGDAEPSEVLELAVGAINRLVKGMGGMLQIQQPQLPTGSQS